VGNEICCAKLKKIKEQMAISKMQSVKSKGLIFTLSCVLFDLKKAFPV